MKRFVKIPNPAGAYVDEYGTRYLVEEVVEGGTVISPYEPQEAESLDAFLRRNRLHAGEVWP